MILHLLSLLMVMMMLCSVIGAPGQMSRTWKYKPRPKSSGTLDSIGGGHLLGADTPDQSENNFRSLELLVSYKDDVSQDMILVARNDKQEPSRPSGTIDTIGGGHLGIGRIADTEAEADVFRAQKLLLENQDFDLQNLVQLSAEDKSKQMAPNLDPLGGGNMVRNADSDTETELSRSVGSSLENQMSRTWKYKPRPKSSGTLDSLGGGHILRADSPDQLENNFRSLELLVSYKDDAPQDMILVARNDKQKPSSSGTLDPIGGGNLIRIVDPEAEAEVFGALESLLENQDFDLQNLFQLSAEDKSKQMAPNLDPLGGGNMVINADSDTETEVSRSVGSSLENQARQNMMRLAREDKLMQRSSHALDGLRGEQHLADNYRGPFPYRSLERSHLVDAADQGGDVQRMLDSLSASDLLSLDSGERMAVLNALRSTHSKYPKRMLDSVSGWAFGESKRNFDEIDNVGFTGFAKRGPSRYNLKQLALAKKNFDEIDRAGFETYNKRDFDEIDRTGFDTFEKRDRKE